MRVIGVAVVLVFSLVAAPLAADGQQAGKVPRIGLLSTQSLPYVEAFRQGLRDLGYVEGRTIVIEYREAEGHFERLPNLAKELVGLNVDIIVTAGGAPSALAAKAATKTIPVVFLAGGVVAGGLVSSLPRPGGNLTGLDVLVGELDPKRLEILKEALPRAIRVAFLWNPGGSGYSPSEQRKRLEAAAQALGVRLRMVEARVPSEIDTAFAALARERPDALLVQGDAMLNSQRRKIVELAAQTRIPAIYAFREFVEVGGLMFYGASLPDMYRRAATYVDKILKGAKPADLPIEQPTKFELVINLKTAKALGLTIPPSVLDHVIE
jgi:putative ABC transport system substrate-binding protein